MSETTSTEQKARYINMDDSFYGAIVEIGAGQEVARQFFAAGGAAGTVAKTMSAYDMTVSDSIYGKAHRYVSRERLQQMLEREYSLLVSRLERERPASRYFAYGATVAARSYSGKGLCHGWVGVRFQHAPSAAPSQILLHVCMHDDENSRQADALGVLGINLLHSIWAVPDDAGGWPYSVVDGLDDNLAPDRLETDFVRFCGPAFEGVENRLLNLHLITSWKTRAVMFDGAGVETASCDMLHRKNAMIIRGTFKPPTLAHQDMAEVGFARFAAEEDVSRDDTLVLAEITMHDLVSGDAVNPQDFLARVDLLCSLGYSVLITDYLRFFRLRSWLRRYTDRPIGIVLSVLDFDYLFDERYYQGLEGGILEAMGKLFVGNTHVYVYPALVDGVLRDLHSVDIRPHLRHLLSFVIANKMMVPLDDYREDNLPISARAIARQIPLGPGKWQQQLPRSVARAIEERGLFGYNCAAHKPAGRKAARKKAPGKMEAL